MVTLIVLDGFGISKKKEGNAIVSQGTPSLDKLLKLYPHTILSASGSSVGLPQGQMGNSEVGHLTLGAGRTIYQDLLKINQSINDKSFFRNPSLLKAIAHAKKNSSALHLIGLVSNGGVHSHINHLFALLDACKDLPKVYIHCITDGRDTATNSGISFLQEIETKIKGSNAKIASVCGRIFAMDREEHYDRLKKAYDMVVNGKPCEERNAVNYISQQYSKGIYDEFIEPMLLNKDATINDGDSVIFFNYRSDRARELSFALTDKNFDKFKVKCFKNLLFSPMQEYSDKLKDCNVLFPNEEIKDNLSAIISKNRLKQFHIAETTKYAHVTFFFNGGIEKAYDGEERKLIDSIDTQDFSYYPKMRAIEITEATLEKIASAEYDFILVNYSNPDMIGHTGNFNATKEAIECVEKQAYALALATLMAGGDCIITADHGNAEYMFDENGNKVTSHTTNPVPFILVSERFKKVKLNKNRSIAAVAPTVLKLLNLPPSENMEKSLF